MSESSTANSRPVECYRFDIDGHDPLLLTSDELPVTAETVTYQPQAGLSRSALSITTNAEPAEMSVSVPATSTLARMCGVFGTPREISLDFRRYQRADLNASTFRFSGVVSGVSIRSGTCTLSFPDVFSGALARKIPPTITQQQCSWRLGDSFCAASTLAAHRVDVLQLVTDGPWLIVMGQHGAIEDRPVLWRGGVLTAWKDSVARESRGILDVTELWYDARFSRSKAQLRLAQPISEVYMSDPAVTFTIDPGCNGSLARCREYENEPKFGGFPHLPTERLNPFARQLNRKPKS